VVALFWANLGAQQAVLEFTLTTEIRLHSACRQGSSQTTQTEPILGSEVHKQTVEAVELTQNLKTIGPLKTDVGKPREFDCLRHFFENVFYCYIFSTSIELFD
jgi:hypothetical protein